MAALAAEGESRISETAHIDRGYEDIAGTWGPWAPGSAGAERGTDEE
ncbi:MAG: hypothetical protein V8R40_10880 [Dysosmobacter sp.]